MDTLSYKTKSARKEDVVRDWYIVDATNQTLGRMSSKIAQVLRGKHKPSFTPHVDTGDYVIVINAEKVRLTGNKWNDKVYLRYSGYPGGQSSKTAKQILDSTLFFRWIPPFPPQNLQIRLNICINYPVLLIGNIAIQILTSPSTIFRQSTITG